MTGEQIPTYAVETDPGDVVFFDQRLFHASFDGSTQRRMFTMNFAGKPSTDAHVAFHRRLYEGHLKFQQNNPFYHTDRVYHPEFLTGSHPRRRQVVQPLIAWGFR